MTRKDSAPEFDPRHRIIGAIVVTGLAVVFIPMVLSEGPPADTGAPARVVAAIEAAPPERPNRVVVTPVTPPAAPARAAPAEHPEASGSSKESSPASAAAPAAAAAPARPEAGWVVQVGTFSNAANARRLEQRLRDEGESILTERVRLASGEAVRLRVGPFADREAAQRAQARIRKETGLKGVVLAYP
jgi:DedD protein